MESNRFRTSLYITVLIHSISWVGIFALAPVIRYVADDRLDTGFFLNTFYLVFHLYLIGLFYLNAYLLVPQIMYRKGIGFYIASILLLVVCTGAMLSLTIPPPHGRHHHHYNDFFFSAILPGFFVIAVSTSYRIMLDRLKSERTLSNQVNETLKTELSFLRSQISPHFMFNVLNNTVALARKKSELLEPTLIKLSHLMRYMLYDSDESKVSLEKETEYLRNYIDLQKQRFGDELKLHVEINNSSRDDIEPMLLIHFVENAFKHGTGMIENPEIDVNLRTWDHELLFSVVNKYDPNRKEAGDVNSGIGLKNVERRLKLLYGDNFQLEMGGKSGTYVVQLKIKFK